MTFRPAVYSHPIRHFKSQNNVFSAKSLSVVKVQLFCFELRIDHQFKHQVIKRTWSVEKRGPRTRRYVTKLYNSLYTLPKFLDFPSIPKDHIKEDFLGYFDAMRSNCIFRTPKISKINALRMGKLHADIQILSTSALHII